MGRPRRAEIRTRDGRSRGRDTNHYRPPHLLKDHHTSLVDLHTSSIYGSSTLPSCICFNIRSALLYLFQYPVCLLYLCNIRSASCICAISGLPLVSVQYPVCLYACSQFLTINVSALFTGEMVLVGVYMTFRHGCDLRGEG